MNVADIVSRHAAATPDAPAIVTRERTWSYRDFDGAIWRAAAGLRDCGIGPGETIGVSLPDGALHLVIGYALARMGAVQLPLPLREPPAVRAALAERFGARRVVGGDIMPREQWLEPGAADASLRAPGGDAPWKIVMTSGTTAAPKAVAQTHAMHLAWREIYRGAFNLPSDTRYLVIVDLGFFGGFRLCMDTLAAGGAVVLDGKLPTSRAVVEALVRLRITSLYMTPVHLTQLLPVLPPDRPLLPALRLRTGSMVVPEALGREIRQRLTLDYTVTYGNNDLGAPLALATTETQDRFPGSLGFPPRGVELQVVDEAGRPLPAGATGEIRVRSPGMPSGYVGNPAASARAFRDGWHYTGDLGTLSTEGALYFKGRTDDQINFDGIKIYPVEIEAALLEHPLVAEAAAFPLPAQEHYQAAAAAVVLRGELPHAELKTYLAAKLGERAPAILARLDALPRNAMGKVDKKALARLVREKLERGHER